MKNLIRFLLLTVITSLMFFSNSYATLIGDTVNANHFYPDDQSGGTHPATIVVQAGTADLISNLNSAYTVNIEASEILVSFQSAWPAGFYSSFGTADFNGLIISGLNDSSGYSLSGVTINTNMTSTYTLISTTPRTFGYIPWDSNERLEFGADYVKFNWEGLQYDRNTYFNASLEFAPTINPVPEPGTIVLLGLGIAGIAVYGKRRMNKEA